ncbi:MAG TPA: TIGR03936 family radical SAM-associated protein [Syntrophomonas sp.]|nr:TIGR03936 family radical SAM-associated protein [Syntrophomonas sp.]
MRLRVEYCVGPELKFLANLDMMHLMERALRRAEIPYRLSEGFNPHIRLSMGTVLPVGIWGKREYFDLDMAGMDLEEFMYNMNAVLPPAMNITNCRRIEDHAPALMKIINAADYSFILKKGHDLQALVNNILSRDSLPVQSRGKNKNLVKDLRPGLYRLEITGEDDYDIMTARVSINEPLNIRYDELQALFIDFELNVQDIADICRQGNYIKEGQDFYSPLERCDEW